MITLLASLLLAGQASAAPITKLEGAAGCVADISSPLVGDECSGARALKDVTDVAISPDGRRAYSVSYSSNAVNTFLRNPSTGALQQVRGVAGCFVDAEQATNPGCATARGLEGPTAIAISPDGNNVYVTGFELNTDASPPRIRGSLVTFERNPSTGVLKQLPELAGGCFSGDALPPIPPRLDCPPAPLVNAPSTMAPLATATDVEVSPDGKSVVTSSFLQGAVTNWTRGPDGVLEAQECQGSTRTLFPASNGSASPGSCTPADGLAYPTDVEISRDGNQVYAAALGLEAPATAATAAEDEPGSVARFDRDASGDLTQPGSNAGCVGDESDPVENCTNTATGIVSPFRVSVSPDSKNAYVSSLNVFPPPDAPGPGPGALAVFDASLAQLPQQPCLQQLGLPPELPPYPECSATVFGLVLPSDVGFSPDGTSLYLSSLFHSVASFDRDTTTGLLAQDAPKPGCTVDPRNLTGGTALLAAICQNAIPLNAPSSVEVSPDGRNVYVTSGGFLTGQPDFGPALASAGITSDNSITVFGPTPPPVPPPPPIEPRSCHGTDATIVAVKGEELRGTPEADVIVGSSAADSIRARGGPDLICAAGGGDVVKAGGGADDVRGGSGGDSIDGQGDRDRLAGGGGADALRGGAARDALLGQGGRDRMRGNGGGDRLSGGKSSDRLNGGAGKDRCRGGAGRDRLRSCED